MRQSGTGITLVAAFKHTTAYLPRRSSLHSASCGTRARMVRPSLVSPRSSIRAAIDTAFDSTKSVRKALKGSEVIHIKSGDSVRLCWLPTLGEDLCHQQFGREVEGTSLEL